MMVLILRTLLLLSIILFPCLAVPAVESPRDIDFGLEHNEQVRSQRNQFELMLAKFSANKSYYLQMWSSLENSSQIGIKIDREALILDDNMERRRVDFQLFYNSSVPLIVSYDLDSTNAIELANYSWYRLPAANNFTFNISVHALPRQIGLAYIRFFIREAALVTTTSEQQVWPLDSSPESTNVYYANVAQTPQVLNTTQILGFPIIVLRGKGIVQLVFRIVVVTMVTLFTFTMGCELDPILLKSYFRRPVGPAIGFCCQFIIMPLVAFTIAWFVPIKREFGFGLLTIGCSPGGGASNAWSLMLGGDINLSILMTFISSFSALFMMPLLLFIFGRFFIDVHHVQIPYGSICIQLLQIAIPALAGLGLRCWKPKIAKFFTKLTRPLFIFFIIFFLSFGIYANWSIFRLIGSYPIVMPTGALLPWLGFSLAALVAFVLRQPRSVIITVALETGIQNIGAAILVLLYSMPQPAGDLGAVMPITVSIFTPMPLYLIFLGVTIKRRCCDRPSAEETRVLKVDDDITEKHPVGKETVDVVDGLLEHNQATRV